MVVLVELADGRAGLVGPGRLVPAAVATPVLEAERVLAAAKAEAEAIVFEAGRRAEAIRAEAYAEGQAKAKEQLQDRLIELAEASLSIIGKTEERIIDLALQIARRIIGDLDAGEVAARVAFRSLKLAGRSGSIRLRIAPGYVDGLRARLEEAMPGVLATVEVIGDPRMQDAGCTLETDAGLVDATIDSQVEALRRGLRGSLSGQG